MRGAAYLLARLKQLIAPVVVLPVILTITPLSAQDADWSSVIAAAKKEGQVVFYNGSVGLPESISKLFQQKYGIEVLRVDGRATEIRERIRTEQASGRFIGDIMVNGLSTAGPQKAEGTLQAHGVLANAREIKPPFVDDGTLTPIVVNTFGMMVNTTMVKPEDEPKSWADLLDPKWKGKILSDDPRAAGGGVAAFSVLLDVLGRDFHNKLAEQNLVMVRDVSVATQRVGRGEYPIFIPMSVTYLNGVQGMPVKGIMPREGAPYSPIVGAMVKQAPHPNAARLFLNFLIEPEAQAILIDRGSRSPTGAESATVSPHVRDLVRATLMGPADPTRQPEMLKLFSEIYK